MDEDGLALWEILDDIDTIGDMARSDDAGYRKLVSKRVKNFDLTFITQNGRRPGMNERSIT